VSGGGVGDRLAVFLGTGFGLGWSSYAPGTVGTLPGFLWLWILLLPGSLTLYFLGILAGTLAAVWIGHRAEKALNLEDPGCVVIDEIIAIPIAFSAWVVWLWLPSRLLPTFSELFQGPHALFAFGLWAAFRFFDILKPWPVFQVQRFGGGWGLVFDDVLAAGYVCLLTPVALKLLGWG
jgi:phosphatidylglycerophosphatase A